jgi:hypothetical protein
VLHLFSKNDKMEVKMTEMGENETEKMVKRAQNGVKMK